MSPQRSDRDDTDVGITERRGVRIRSSSHIGRCEAERNPSTTKVEPMEPHDDDALLTPSEVAAMFRVNPKTVTRWARAGQDLGDSHPRRSPAFPCQ